MNDRAIAGEFVTRTFDYDGSRQVTVYVPPALPEAVVFAGDGQRISQWGGLLEAAHVPSTMIVGVHGLTDEKLRLQEYSPGAGYKPTGVMPSHVPRTYLRFDAATREATGRRR
jgi:hypothetical protein